VDSVYLSSFDRFLEKEISIFDVVKESFRAKKVEKWRFLKTQFE